MLSGVVDKWPKWAKILLIIFGGASTVYRVFLFVDDCIAKKETKNVNALVVAIILDVITGVASGLTNTGNTVCTIIGGIVSLVPLVVAIIDIVTVVKNDEFSFLCFKDAAKAE